MMNGEIPSVPITTLAGISSLTDLLPEMPLPTPMPQTLNNRSLLFHPRVAEEANILLSLLDDNLIPQLVQSLNQTPALNIELKIPYPQSENSLKGGPELLKAIVGKVPNIFECQGKDGSLMNSNIILSGSNSVIVNPVSGFKPGDIPHENSNSLLSSGTFSSLKDSNIEPIPGSKLNNSAHNIAQADKPIDRFLSNSTPNGSKLSVGELPDNVLSRFENIESVTSSSANGHPVAPPSLEPAASKPPRKETTISPAVPRKQSPSRENDKSKKKSSKNNNSVFFNKLSTKDQELMQKSLNEYVQKSVMSKINQPNDGSEENSVANEEKVDLNTVQTPKVEPVKCEEEVSEPRGRRKKRILKSDPETKPHISDDDIPKAKLRKIERRLVPVLEKLNVEELMETNTYQRFNRTIERILEDACDDDTQEEEGSGGEEESAISKYQLGELVSEAAKLKALGAMESVPSDRLTRILTVLERNMRVGARVSPVGGSDPNDGEEERRLFFEVAMERVSRAVDASLAALYILTSPNMHKRVYLEDVIDRVVLCAKFQLHNTIYPSFDPVYRQADPAALPPNRKKRAHCKEVREKNLLLLYNKLSEVVLLLAELLDIQKLTDNSVLHTTTMGVSPFFVEGVSDLQLSALKLVTTIFMKYEKHRKLLLEDILASMARLPSSKRSLRSFRLSGEEHIQMLTALVLQLVQCVVCLPTNLDPARNDLDPILTSHYRAAKTTATNFLYAFLGKCSSKQEEIDYRPVFENFVQDLLTTVNRPEWPAAELMLSVLGSLLVNNFVNKNLEISLRVASLDYLGVVAARLRKDTVTSATKLSKIDQLVKEIKSAEVKEELDEEFEGNSEEERARFLQRVLLDYLAMRGQTEHSMNLARHFYIAMWYQDFCNKPVTPVTKKSKKKKKKSSRRGVSDDDSDEEEIKEVEPEQMENCKKFELHKRFLVGKIRPFEDNVTTGSHAIQTYIDYNSAELVARFLASKRPFSQSFDTYLKHILNVLTETSVLIRTKAMKCLTSIVEVDAGVLALKDMQLGVSHSFLDHSTSVREAAVDLVGKFILSRPDLIPNYYDMLSARILDTGVSVRKRVIKILKDVCQECPDFPKIPEICVKMIRRVNDEEGIRKLVLEVFQNMWFTPVREKPVLDSDTLVRKVMNMTDVIAVSNEVSLEWLEQLLVSLVKGGEEVVRGEDEVTKAPPPPSKGVLQACKQIADCLVELVLRLDGLDNSAQRLVACHTALHLLARIHPNLLVHHAQTLQPYLSLKCQTHTDYQIISCVARTLELVVPLVEHPSETFLSRLEEDSVKLMMQQDPVVVSSCVSCLGSIVNSVTRNFALIRDCLKKYYGFLTTYRHCLEVGGVTDQTGPRFRPPFRRSLYVVGLLLRFFDFTDPEVLSGLLPDSIKDDVFDTFMYFLNHEEFSKHYTLKAVGNMCVRYYDLMLSKGLKELYHSLLMDREAPLPMKVQVLTNIEIYLQEEERRMIRQDAEWAKMAKQENLKEMGDLSSGMASTVVQVYLKEILESFVHPHVNVRNCALRVIQLILAQGLVHPVQIVPYLICMSSDDDKVVAHSADKQLQDIEKKYPGFIHMKAKAGVRLSFQLQKVLRDTDAVRGFRAKEGEFPSALNGFLYSALRSKQQKRAIILSILKQFDEQVKTSLSFMLYLADNMAYFPYLVQDEPLFIIHHIDIMISVTGTNLLQSFREALIPVEGRGGVEEEEEDDDDEEALLSRVPENTTILQEALTASQGCLLLLVLKNHLKALYGFNDAKITQYSPSESNKLYDKPVNRKTNNRFDPKATVHKLKEGSPPTLLDEGARRNLILEYLEFKTLIMNLDPDDMDDGESKEEGQLRVREIIARKVTMEEMKEGEPPRVPKLTIVRQRKTTSEHSPRVKADHRSRKHHRRKKKHRYSESTDNESSDPDYFV